MKVFTRTEETQQLFLQFIESVDAVAVNLSDAANEHDLQLLHKLKDSFKLKTNDFFRENRKLNIGVVGQVKAGKSSFLNTLLFNGAEVLPKASTPKTATLTKMEYAEHNRIHIEYYSVEEWEILEENAAVDLDDEVYQTAREIVGMVKNSGIDPVPYLEQGFEEQDFDTYEQLMANLNAYVGEDGRFTPLVKAVTLFLNKKEFKEISIVDTPGLNDPIASRTIRTKEFIEVCDVVFFLSQSGSFLDKSDWTLLSSQLPQKGVKKLVLVASKFDSGIRDVLRHKDEDDLFDDWEDDNSADTIPKACQIITRKLKRRAHEKVTEFVADLKRRGSSDELIAVIEQCKDPILVSAMSHNMASKPYEDYTDEEQNVYRALNEFSTDMMSDLRMLGNIGRIQDIFAEVVMGKEEILGQKARGFVPTAQEELRQLLTNFREKSEKKLGLLTGNDREQLLEQKRAIENQIRMIKTDVVTVFGELNVKLEAEKSEAVRELRAASKQYFTLTERTGTEVKTGTRTYSTSKWYNPFSWGTSSTEHYTYDVSYSYLEVSDALDNLRSYAVDALNEVETVFSDSLQIKEVKRKLLNVVINNFDMGSEKYDSSFFRLLVEEKVNNIEFPIIKIDISHTIKQLVASFNGQIRSSSEKAGLNDALMSAVSTIFDNISNQLAGTVKSFKAELNQIAEQLTASLLESVQDEFNEVLAKFEDREQEIEKYRNYIYQLTSELKQI